MRIFKTSRLVILLILLPVLANFERLSSQTSSPPKPDAKTVPKSDTDKSKTPTFDELWNAYPKDGEKIVITDYSDHFAMKWLRRDYRIADVVVYVNVIKRKLIDHTEGADCENDRGTGYCAYLLTAEVKEVYKGEIKNGKLEFVGTSDADYPKKGFMGEKVEFLTWGNSEPSKERKLGTMENSTRWIDYRVLDKMRVVIDSNAQIDEKDEDEPYSRVAIKKNFEEAEAVAFVEALRFRPDKDSMFETGAIVTAVVKEVFKGDLKVNQTLEYRHDFLTSGFRKNDLGPQIVYLKRYKPIAIDRMEYDKSTGKTVRVKGEVYEKGVVFENEDYTEGFIKHNILEKLREIAPRAAK